MRDQLSETMGEKGKMGQNGASSPDGKRMKGFQDERKWGEMRGKWDILRHLAHSSNPPPLGRRAFNWGVDRAPWLAPPPKKKAAHLTGPRDSPPGLGGDPDPKNRLKNKNGIFGISALRGFRKLITCLGSGEKKICPSSMLKTIFQRLRPQSS